MDRIQKFSWILRFSSFQKIFLLQKRGGFYIFNLLKGPAWFFFPHKGSLLALCLVLFSLQAAARLPDKIDVSSLLKNDRPQLSTIPTIDPEQVQISAFLNGYALIMKDGKTGLLDKNGDLLTELNFDFIDEYFNGIAAASHDWTSKTGLIDERGEWVLPPEYDYLRILSNGLILAKGKNERFGLIDRSGQWILSPRFNYIGDFSNGLAPATPLSTRSYYNGGVGLIDTKGTWVLPPDYDYIRLQSKDIYPGIYHPQVFFSRVFPNLNKKLVYEDLAIVGYQDQIGVMSLKNWEWILPPIADEVIIYENMALIREGSKFSLIDISSDSLDRKILPFNVRKAFKGVIITEFYPSCGAEESSNFDEMLNENLPLSDNKLDSFFGFGISEMEDTFDSPALGCHNTARLGLADFEGRELLKPEFDFIGTFSKEGISFVEKAGSYALINERGEFLTGFMALDFLGEFVNGYAPAVLNGKAGLMDLKGEWVIPPEFDKIGVFSEGLIAAEKGDKIGYINLQGTWIIELNIEGL